MTYWRISSDCSLNTNGAVTSWSPFLAMYFITLGSLGIAVWMTPSWSMTAQAQESPDQPRFDFVFDLVTNLFRRYPYNEKQMASGDILTLGRPTLLRAPFFPAPCRLAAFLSIKKSSRVFLAFNRRCHPFGTAPAHHVVIPSGFGISLDLPPLHGAAPTHRDRCNRASSASSCLSKVVRKSTELYQLARVGPDVTIPANTVFVAWPPDLPFCLKAGRIE